MSEIAIRLAILLAVGLVVALLVWIARRLVEGQRKQALAAVPLATASEAPSASSFAPVRILAFSSVDCRQCHQLQTPALERVIAVHGDTVAVTEVDATVEQQLVQTYRVLTVPSTVILDAQGHVHAVNYGFANTQRLLKQIEELL